MGIKENLKSFASGYFQTGGWNGRNLDLWHPDHPLNNAAQWGSSGLTTNREQIENDYLAYVQGAFKTNGPVFSCITARQMVFSEAVFKFKNKKNGKIHGSTELDILDAPWPGGTTGDLLSRMEQDASLAGNSWWTLVCDTPNVYGRAARGRPGARFAHLPANWVTMLIGNNSSADSPTDPRAIDAKLTGILYRPTSIGGGVPGGGKDLEDLILPIEDVVHYAPIPDPAARFRGMSWLTPVLRDIEADKSAVKHKGAFFDNAAVPNMAVSFDKETSKEDFLEFVEQFNGNHSGAWNAYRTLFLMGGADVTPLSHDFRALDFTNIVGKGEARIASAAGVPPSWVGMSEGMQGSALNTGNMAANRRRFADGTIRPLWRNAAACLAVLIDVPTDSVLWWDETDIAFLREDQKDLADIMQVYSTAIDSWIRSGFEPDACVSAAEKNDLSQLIGHHTGLVSVQMQPPVDPNNKLDESEAAARILEINSRALGELVSAGFTHESSVEALDKQDMTLLKKDPKVGAWSPTGQPLRTTDPTTGSPGGGKPGTPPPTAAAPAGKPKPTAQSGQPKPKPGGGGNG